MDGSLRAAMVERDTTSTRGAASRQWSPGGPVVACAVLVLVACGKEFSASDDPSSGGNAGDSGVQGGESGAGTAGTAGASGSAGAGGSGGGGSGGASSGGPSGGGSSGGTPGMGGSGGAGSGSGGAGAGSGGRPCLQELLANGDFDDGPASWSEEASDDTPLIFHRANTLLIDQGIEVHAGDYLAWLGGVEGRTARVWQAVTLPEDAATIHIAGFVLIDTEESNETVYDQAYVELVQGNTALALGHFTNQDEVSQWTEFEGSIGAEVFRDEPITFQLRSDVDSSANTAFFFDSITLTAELTNCQ
jgi:hypothetical protein